MGELLEINEYIQFKEFNSRAENLYLINREAPTPDEKSIIKNIPFQQGVLDFSMILGERVFENRKITYEFILFDTPYQDRKYIERSIKQKLMPHSNEKLFDTYTENFFWVGKCESVEVEHDYQFNKFKVTIIFDCYPYMFEIKNVFDDYWDDFDFNNDTAAYTRFLIRDRVETVIGNGGSISVRPEIIATHPVKMILNGETFHLRKGVNKEYHISLKPGANTVVFEGFSELYFRYRREVMG